MNSQLTQLLLLLVWMVAVVSVTAGLTYCIMRLLVGKYQVLHVLAGLAAIVFVILLLTIAQTDSAYLLALMWLLICSAIGSLFHRASYSVPPSWRSGFLLLFNVAGATLSLSFFVLTLCDSIVPYFSTYAQGNNFYTRNNPFIRVDLALVFAYICFTAPLAVTAFLRVFQASKLRPGLDHHSPLK